MSNADNSADLAILGKAIGSEIIQDFRANGFPSPWMTPKEHDAYRRWRPGTTIAKRANGDTDLPKMCGSGKGLRIHVKDADAAIKAGRE